jgi:hypothetical protein
LALDYKREEILPVEHVQREKLKWKENFAGTIMEDKPKDTSKSNISMP